MKTISIKILLIVIAILMINSILFKTTSYATTMDNVIKQGDEFLSIGADKKVIDEDKLGETSSTIYNILFTIAVVLAVAVGMIIGIQFIIASVDEKAKIKEILVPYVVGVFIVFAAFTIWKIAVGIGNNVAPQQIVDVQDNDEQKEPIDNAHICPTCKDNHAKPTGKTSNGLVGSKQYKCKNGHEFWSIY